ncbi:tetratricopeptide repeat protein [Ferruginibacter sp.]|nr:tetratricopeptide repeat protein [Ferruginibacter sp.]
MKKILVLLTTILFSGIVFAQTAYDPLTDPNVQKPANPALFLENMRVMRQLEILQGTEYSRAKFQAFLDDFNKTKTWTSTIQKVVVRNNLGNNAEIEEKYEIAKQQYYQVVWNKNDYSGYPTDDPIVGFYYFKTCYDLGRLLSKMGDYKNSYEFYTAAVDFYKTDSSLYFAAVAGLNGIKGKTISAVTEGGAIFKNINKAVELKPNNSAYISIRGQYYLEITKDTVKALADFNKAVQLNPNDESTYEYLAIIYYYQSNFKEAINNISRCIAINKYEASYYNKRAIFYNYQKNYQAALADYNEAIFLNQTNNEYYLSRALCYVTLKNYAAAYDDYGFATMLNPSDADSKKELQKLDPLLKTEYEKLGFTPQNAYQFFLQRADKLTLLSEGFKLGPAIMNYYKCIQIEPKNPLPYNKAGILFRQLNMNKYAEQFLRYAAYADGKNPEYFFHLGKYYYENVEEYKKASNCFDTAALLGSVNVSGYITNGEIKYLKLNNKDGALKDFNTALSLEPANKAALTNRGVIYFDVLKNYKAALADFEAVKKLNPNDKQNNSFIEACKEKLK